MSTAKDFGKVAVLMGGRSAEREISLISGAAVLAALQARGVDAHKFDPAETPLWALKEQGFSRAFIALHGRFGEDGTVQGALEVMGIPYTGSGVAASGLAMDKWRTKLVWLSTGVPTPKYCLLQADTDLASVGAELGWPVIVKPAREGSSIGVSKANDLAELSAAYAAASALDSLVIAEEFVVGRELTAAVLGDKALPLVRIEVPTEGYDYQNKYFTDVVRYHCPSGLSAETEAAIQTATLQAFKVLGCRGWGRADVILRADGSFTLLEMNTAPGMTSHSLVPMAAREAGLPFEDLCVAILADAALA